MSAYLPFPNDECSVRWETSPDRTQSPDTPLSTTAPPELPPNSVGQNTLQTTAALHEDGAAEGDGSIWFHYTTGNRASFPKHLIKRPTFALAVKSMSNKMKTVAI